jgi:flagellar basal-body rod modification protein FlgD
MTTRVQNIGAIAQAAPPETASMQGIDKDAFMKLLVAQLRYQNPLAPTDGVQFLQQAAVMAQVERMDALAKMQAEAAAYQQLILTASLVGRRVTGRPEGADDPVTGVVDAVRFRGGAPILVVGDREIPLAGVEELGVPPATGGPGPSPEAAAGDAAPAGDAPPQQ